MKMQFDGTSQIQKWVQPNVWTSILTSGYQTAHRLSFHKLIDSFIGYVCVVVVENHGFGYQRVGVDLLSGRNISAQKKVSKHRSETFGDFNPVESDLLHRLLY